MDHRVNILKNQFSDISSIINDNEKIFRLLESRIVRLKTTYEEFIITNKDKLFVFGLDSFHFQGKLIDIEYDDMVRMYNAILNRMYCEYYKLYKIVIQYINDSVQDSKIKEMSKLNIFPIYLDLEPFKQYGFETIQNLHENILELLVTLGSYLRNKELELSKYQTKNRIGLSIDNFVNTFRYNNVMMEERIMLFIAYIEFFHKMHNKYLVRFLTKIKLMYSQVSHDIRFDDNAKLGRDEKVDMIHNLKGDHVERDIIHNIKDYVTDLGSGSDVDSETSAYDARDRSITPVSGPITPSRVQFENIAMKIEEAENENEETSSVKDLIKSFEERSVGSNEDDKSPMLGVDEIYEEVPMAEVAVFQKEVDNIPEPETAHIEEPTSNIKAEPFVEKEVSIVVDNEINPIVKESLLETNDEIIEESTEEANDDNVNRNVQEGNDEDKMTAEKDEWNTVQPKKNRRKSKVNK
jgi:hypothetical protein